MNLNLMLLRREHLISLTTRKIFIFVRTKNTRIRILPFVAAYGSQWAVPPFFTVVSTVLSCKIKITSLYKTTRNKQTKMDDVEKGNTNMKKSSSLQDVLGSKNNLKADSVFRCVVF